MLYRLVSCVFWLSNMLSECIYDKMHLRMWESTLQYYCLWTLGCTNFRVHPFYKNQIIYGQLQCCHFLLNLWRVVQTKRIFVSILCFFLPNNMRLTCCFCQKIFRILCDVAYSFAYIKKHAFVFKVSVQKKSARVFAYILKMKTSF